jgi:hypothetical protein
MKKTNPTMKTKATAPTARPVATPLTVEQLQQQATALHQRARLFEWLAAQLVDGFGRGDRDDPPLPLRTADGGTEPPMQPVVAEVRAELLRGALHADTAYWKLMAAPVEVGAAVGGGVHVAR